MFCLHYHQIAADYILESRECFVIIFFFLFFLVLVRNGNRMKKGKIIVPLFIVGYWNACGLVIIINLLLRRWFVFCFFFLIFVFLFRCYVPTKPTIFGCNYTQKNIYLMTRMALNCLFQYKLHFKFITKNISRKWLFLVQNWYKNSKNFYLLKRGKLENRVTISLKEIWFITTPIKMSWRKHVDFKLGFGLKKYFTFINLLNRRQEKPLESLLVNTGAL